MVDALSLDVNRDAGSRSIFQKAFLRLRVPFFRTKRYFKKFAVFQDLHRGGILLLT